MYFAVNGSKNRLLNGETLKQFAVLGNEFIKFSRRIAVN